MKYDLGPERSVAERLFHTALMILGTAIALTITLSLLASIWPWLVGIGLLVGGGVAWARIASARRRNW